MFLTLPVPEETRRLRLALGHWNEEQAEWDTSSGILSPGKTAISDSIYSFSEFAVIGVSKPLGLENLEFHPNPFSPYHPSGKNLQIEFILNSQLSSTPVVSIKVFNLRGDLVRTLINNEQMEKGPHYYINGVFQDGVPDGSVEWDGFTDNNLMARNGRYVVQIKVKDPSGEKTRVGTIVLIK
jgi:hypothetical protein